MGTERVVDYYEHEDILVRNERANRRLWILCIILIVALIGTNGAWLYHESMYRDVVTTIEATQEGEGTNYISGGDLSFGAESQNNNPDAGTQK